MRTEAFERFFKKGEGSGVPCREDHHIDVFFHCPIVKDSGRFRKLLHTGFHGDGPTEDRGGQLIVYNQFPLSPWTREKIIHCSYVYETLQQMIYVVISGTLSAKPRE